jgi:AcrR family transcriptional regulator
MARITKDPETRRKEFITAARELFMEKGFNQTSVSDITNKLGMSHGSFFYYFKSKNDVMKEVIKDNLNYWKNFMENLVTNEDMNALQKMQVVFRVTIESQRTKQNINEFFQKEGNAVMYREHIKKSREIVIPLLTRIVEQGIKEGTLKVEYPRETVEFVSYIVENLGDSLKSAQSEEEYLRKIRALEAILSKIAGIDENELNLVKYGETK